MHWAIFIIGENNVEELKKSIQVTEIIDGHKRGELFKQTADQPLRPDVSLYSFL